MPAGRRQQQIAKLIEDVVSIYADRLLPFDERCGREYGPVLLAARQSGKPIVAADAMIAATAKAHGMRIAARNLTDFAGAGVPLIDPWSD